MNKSQVIQQIRFGIDQLKSTNGTLTFEHICRFFSRSRITRNILPATGPVQSGGDQGRDFETFHSYISKTEMRESCSMGFSENPIVFACSLEENPLKKNGKIDKDVKTILASGIAVERIYFFSGRDIPVGIRHKKQNELLDRHKVVIEVIDAQALSEHLSDPDLFWIANQYLNIPNDFFPRINEENWYEKLYLEYNERTIQTTYQEFSEIKTCVRYIYKDANLVVDLPFWLKLLDLFICENIPRDLKRLAIYEKCVAKIVGQNDVSGLDSLFREYLSNMDQYINPASLDDTQIFLSFVKNTKPILGHGITDNEITYFTSNLKEIISKELLRKDISRSQRCSYIEVEANLFLNENLIMSTNLVEVIDGYIFRLSKITPHLFDAPFFALERFSKRLIEFTKIFIELDVDISKLEKFSERVDEFLGKKNGEFIVGNSIRDRAHVYLQANKIPLAISLLHKLKLKWFSTETTKGLILTSMLLAECYEKLNMHYASKYYNLIAADMALLFKDSDDDIIELFPRAICMAANSSYRSGSWIEYLDLLEISITSYHVIEKDFDISTKTENYSMLFYPCLIKLYSQRHELKIVDSIKQRIDQWGYLKDVIDRLYSEIEKSTLYSGGKLDYILKEKIHGIPFNDLGELRTIKFNAYGLDWTVNFKNDYLTNSIGEQFVSMIQICLVELIDSDLFLIRSEVNINLNVASGGKLKYKALPSNIKTSWEIEIPLYNGGHNQKKHEIEFKYVGLITSILRHNSLLSDKNFKQIIYGKLNEGLLNSVTFGETYNILYRDFIKEERFKESARELFDEPKTFEISENKQLMWKSYLPATYSKSNSLTHIKNRIALTSPLEVSLPIFKSYSIFNDMITDLRSSWLDWQIYMALVNIVINYKLSEFKIQLTEDNYADFERFYKIFWDSVHKPEKDWYVEIPIDIVSIENMTNYLNGTNIMTVLTSYGLESHQETPNLIAIKEFLTCRFNFLEDGKEMLVF